MAPGGGCRTIPVVHIAHFIAVGGRQIVGFAASSRHRPKAAYDTPPRRACTSHPTSSAMESAQPSTGCCCEPSRRRTCIGRWQESPDPNDASVALHKRFGFSFAGHFSQQGRKFDRFEARLERQAMASAPVGRAQGLGASDHAMDSSRIRPYIGCRTIA